MHWSWARDVNGRNRDETETLIIFLNQSFSLYRTIVQRRVLQCGYAESKRNVLRPILDASRLRRRDRDQNPSCIYENDGTSCRMTAEVNEVD